MVTLEERVAHLEGRAVEHSKTLDAIRDLHAGLVRQMDLLIARMGQIELRMDRLDARMDRLEMRLEMRMDTFDHKLDQRFAWLLGMQVTTIIAIVAALIAR